jgi:hypothetical protein
MVKDWFWVNRSAGQAGGFAHVSTSRAVRAVTGLRLDGEQRCTEGVQLDQPID